MGDAPSQTLALAYRALARRELSTEELRRRLRRAGAPDEAIEQALARLVHSGYLSDERAAEERARSLCERGLGDEAIRADLAGRGIDAETITTALAALPPEGERAALLLQRAGGGERGLRALRRRGFSQDTVERLAAAAVADEP